MRMAARKRWGIRGEYPYFKGNGDFVCVKGIPQMKADIIVYAVSNDELHQVECFASHHTRKPLPWSPERRTVVWAVSRGGRWWIARFTRGGQEQGERGHGESPSTARARTYGQSSAWTAESGIAGLSLHPGFPYVTGALHQWQMEGPFHGE